MSKCSECGLLATFSTSQLRKPRDKRKCPSCLGQSRTGAVVQVPSVAPIVSQKNPGLMSSNELIIPDAQSWSLAQDYIAVCDKLKSEAHPAILIAIRHHLPSMRPSTTPEFGNAEVLALGELVMASPASFTHLHTLDFSNCRMGSHGAIVVARMLELLPSVKIVYMRNNWIGGFGALPLFDTIAGGRSSVEKLSLRNCMISDKGARGLAKLVGSFSHQCLDVDASNNAIGYEGVQLVENALAHRREQKDVPSMDVNLEGNLVLSEVLNSATHGVGLLMCLLGTYLLFHATKDRTPTHFVASMVYATSLTLLYMSSTLYHSFFTLDTTKRVFRVFDHCAIYILISGTYTPFLSIMFHGKPLWSVYLLTFMWVCCLAGILLTAFYHGPWKSTISLVMYLCMGWASVLCINDVASHLSLFGQLWCVAGGLLYTGGVPFFVLDRHLFHMIWHLFVVAGSLCHFIAIYVYVVPLPLGDEFDIV